MLLVAAGLRANAVTRDQMDRLQPGDVIWSKTRPPVRLTVLYQGTGKQGHGVRVQAPTGEFFINILRAHSFQLELKQTKLEGV